MLCLIVFLPLLAAGVLITVPGLGDRSARWYWVAVAAVDLLLVGLAWARYRNPPPGRFDARIVPS